MWWEILPSFVIITGMMTIAGLSNEVFQRLQNGGKLKRKANCGWDWDMYKRDERIAGKVYKTKGLENLADN
ncbi:NADH dehydrogenase [ubiquinone] 1 alpha subcomplex subunit 1-like [Saccoglossus kowalevskii]